MAQNLLTDNLVVPLDGATTAKVDINSDLGHLTVDQMTGDEQVLANGTLQYFEKQGVPDRSVDTSNGQATLTVRGGGSAQSWLRWPPWAAWSGAYEWQIHLNPAVSSDITAHTNGGNVRLNLAGMAVSCLSAGTSGGNIEVALPDHAANLSATAKTGAGNITVEVGSGITGTNLVTANSGAGNVEVRVPGGIPAKVHATSGLGKVVVDARFSKLDGNTYQSPDYDAAVDKVEIVIHSGAGNVSAKLK